MNIKTVRKGTIKPAKPFSTLEAEANFWDKQLLSSDGTKKNLAFHKENKSDTITIRFEPKYLEIIKSKAFHLGIGPTTLARMWILEKLQMVS